MLSFFYHSSVVLVQRGISYFPITEAIPKPGEMTMLTLRVRRGIPWTSHQFVTGLTCRDKQPFTLVFTPMDNLE